MQEKDFKKLKRSELLEMLLDRSKEVEHLRKDLIAANHQIEQLEWELKTSNSITDALDRLNETIDTIQEKNQI